jgi:hypothetical protein
LEKINGELELTLKKKQVLDKLLHEGKVSQPTFDSFSDEIADAIIEIEMKQNALAEKMKAKIHELEQQIKTMEYLLVNSEIRHVSGESEEEAYERECNTLSLGLETTRRELDDIKEAIMNLSEQDVEATPAPVQLEVEEAEEKTAEPEHTKRIEIIMDTETTTSIETTVEEQPRTEPATEASPETATEQEEKPAAATEEAPELEATAEEEKQQQG